MSGSEWREFNCNMCTYSAPPTPVSALITQLPLLVCITLVLVVAFVAADIQSRRNMTPNVRRVALVGGSLILILTCTGTILLIGIGLPWGSELQAWRQEWLGPLLLHNCSLSAFESTYTGLSRQANAISLWGPMCYIFGAVVGIIELIFRWQYGRRTNGHTA
jgi:hypothetical protein